ncbi:MAG: hypothetical protein IPF99_36190 [Deltaproteobacteria bacterium]|nr:hypothetical protein [Deltaproteobacteria bacterium]
MRRTTSSSSQARPASSKRCLRGSSPATAKTAVTSACVAPVRTMSAAEARAPSTSERASMRMLFPAPVSPVTTLSPSPKVTSTSSMIARSLTCSVTSIAASIGVGRALAPVNTRSQQRTFPVPLLGECGG